MRRHILAARVWRSPHHHADRGPCGHGTIYGKEARRKDSSSCQACDLGRHEEVYHEDRWRRQGCSIDEVRREDSDDEGHLLDEQEGGSEEAGCEEVDGEDLAGHEDQRQEVAGHEACYQAGHEEERGQDDHEGRRQEGDDEGSRESPREEGGGHEDGREEGPGEGARAQDIGSLEVDRDGHAGATTGSRQEDFSEKGHERNGGEQDCLEGRNPEELDHEGCREGSFVTTEGHGEEDDDHEEAR